MGWLKKDDLFHDHPKVDGLSDAANRLWDMCACWARKEKNLKLKGVIPRKEIMSITKRRWTEEKTLELAQELVDANPGNRFTAGLWEVCSEGWFFHDWAHYQPVDDKLPLTLTERARRAGQASKLARLAKYGTAQPMKKIQLSSNNRTSSTSSENAFENDTESTSTDTKVAHPASGSPELSPELSKKTEQVRALVRAPKALDSPNNLELDELVHRTKPRTCRTPINPLRRDLKTLSKEPDRDHLAPRPARKPESESVNISQSGVVSVNTVRPEPVSSCQRCEDTFTQTSPGVMALFDAWRDEAHKPNAELTWRRREGFEKLFSAGVSVEIVRRVVRGAKTDLEWAVGKHRLDPTAILFTPEQREKYLDIEAEKRTPAKRNGPQLFKPEPPVDPSMLATAEQMSEGLAALAFEKVKISPIKPKLLKNLYETSKTTDTRMIEQIDRARQKSKQALEQFERENKSDPPPPIVLEA
jgi:hypothetical protein